MLYFPMIDTTWPEWIPYFGGNAFHFFAPVFNIADMSICTGVIVLLLFNRKVFNNDEEKLKLETVDS